MKYTGNYNLKKPEGTDIVNIDDLNENADIIDQKLKEVEDKTNNAPADSVNDAAIGTRTPDQSQAPASPGTGTLTQLVSWLANRIKTITGKTNWWDAPPTTLQAAKNHIDAAAPHSGHETPSGAQAKVDTHASSKQTHGISSGYYIAKTSRSDQLPAWGDIQGKPSTYPASPHTHPGSEITSAVANATNADKVDNYHIEDIQNDAQTRVNNHASSKQSHGISSGYYIAKTSRSDQLPAWGDIQGKPNSFTPATHGNEAHNPAFALASDLTAHLADNVQHITSTERTAWNNKADGNIRADHTKSLRVEVVSSSGSVTPEQGRIIFDKSQGKFFGGNGSEWL